MQVLRTIDGVQHICDTMPREFYPRTIEEIVVDCAERGSPCTVEWDEGIPTLVFTARDPITLYPYPPVYGFLDPAEAK